MTAFYIWQGNIGVGFLFWDELGCRLSVWHVLVLFEPKLERILILFIFQFLPLNLLFNQNSVETTFAYYADFNNNDNDNNNTMGFSALQMVKNK